MLGSTVRCVEVWIWCCFFCVNKTYDLLLITERQDAPTLITPLEAVSKTEGAPFSLRVGFKGTPTPEVKW